MWRIDDADRERFPELAIGDRGGARNRQSGRERAGLTFLGEQVDFGVRVRDLGLGLSS